MSAATKRRPLYPAAGCAGAFCFAIGVATETPGVGLVLGLLGALFGLYVSGVIRLFPVHPAGFPLIGLLVGPLPLAFIGQSQGDRGGAVLFGLVLGGVLGLLEWSVEAGRTRNAAGAEPPPEGTLDADE